MADNCLNILVFGDSALSSLGCCSKNVFDYFSNGKKYDKEIRFVNSSFVGMTSADIRSNLDDIFKKDSFDCVIIYTGNCDASAYGLLKPYFPLFAGSAVTEIFDFIYKALNPVSKRYSPYGFVPESGTRGKLRRCVTPEDFERNLIAIIRKVIKKNSKLILINPVSKSFFPPLNNLPNACFFKVINVHNDMFLSPDGESIQKIDIRDLYGNLKKDELQRMFAGVSEISADNNLKKIKTNNLSYLYYLDKNEDAVEKILPSVISDKDPYQLINLYNKALIQMFRGKELDAKKLFAAIKEIDCSTYRINREYRHCIERVYTNYKDSIEYVDCGDILNENDFIDYCHPTEAGHFKLFNSLQSIIERMFRLQSGPSVPGIAYRSMNPDRYLGYKKHTFEHFKLVGQANDKFVDSIKELAQSEAYEQILRRSENHEHCSFEEKIKYRILRHPLFGTYDFLNNSPPQYAADQGRFAEFYFLRHMVSISKSLDKCNVIYTLVKETEELSPDFKKLSAYIEDINQWCSIPELPELNRIFEFIDLELVEKRLLLLLKYILKKEPVVFNKYRSISTWFFRESLLFGSTSHCLMYCDRVSLFDLITAMLFILWHWEGYLRVERTILKQD
ncbi:MAG TPA: hypothetical protein VHO70_07420 [Chitinispirillaceae bacterium]|nr:hypothetical protein [Chitinispirillaceae bacterium]